MTIVRYFLGGVCIVVATVAGATGGTFSPFVFGGLGVFLIASAAFVRAARVSSITPLRDSILLRSRLPILWVAMAEVKLATQQPARPLSSIGERMLISGTENPSVCIVLQRFAFDHRGAEAKMLERMRELAKAMAPLGGYLLPLDSSKAAEKLNLSLEDLRLAAESWRHTLSTMHYDILSVECKKGYVTSFAAYVKDGGKSPGRAVLPSPGRGVLRPPLLWELLHSVATRVQWGSPDAYTAFLSSMAATENVELGERVIDMGSDHDSLQLQVRSVSSPTVEVSRAELRTVVGIYTRPSKEGPFDGLLQKVRI